MRGRGDQNRIVGSKIPKGSGTRKGDSAHGPDSAEINVQSFYGKRIEKLTPAFILDLASLREALPEAAIRSPAGIRTLCEEALRTPPKTVKGVIEYTLGRQKLVLRFHGAKTGDPDRQARELVAAIVGRLLDEQGQAAWTDGHGNKVARTRFGHLSGDWRPVRDLDVGPIAGQREERDSKPTDRQEPAPFVHPADADWHRRGKRERDALVAVGLNEDGRSLLSEWSPVADWTPEDDPDRRTDADEEVHVSRSIRKRAYGLDEKMAKDETTGSGEKPAARRRRKKRA